MNKKIYILLAIIIAAFLIIFLLVSKDSKKNGSDNTVAGNTKGASTENQAAVENSDIILFTGKGCPHCEKVEEFLKEKDIASKINFQIKEVWYDKDNAATMQEKAVACNIPQDQLGVPFLYSQNDSKCLIGDPDIIDFFKEKTGTN